MRPSKVCIDFIKAEEGLRLDSYQDAAGVWTIGYGSTMYKTGQRVGPKEKITRQEAEELITWEIENKAVAVAASLQSIKLTQNQFDACVSFAYNAGVSAFANSTLRKVIKKNPADPYIRNCFAMWNKITVNGKKVENRGLTNRRRREADLYFKNV